MKTRKALIRHETEQLEKDLIATRRKIDKQEDYMVPRLEKQLVKIDSDLSDLEAKRSTMTGRGGDEFMNNQLDLSRMGASSPDRKISRVTSGNSAPLISGEQVARPSTQLASL